MDRTVGDVLLFRDELYVEDPNPDGPSPRRYVIAKGKRFIPADPTIDDDDSGRHTFMLDHSFNTFTHEVIRNLPVDGGLVAWRRLRGVPVGQGITIVIPEQALCAPAELLELGEPPSDAWQYNAPVLSLAKYTHTCINALTQSPFPNVAGLEIPLTTFMIGGVPRLSYIIPWYTEVEEEFLSDAQDKVTSAYM